MNKTEKGFKHSVIIEQFKKNCGVIYKKRERNFSDDIIVIVMSRKMVRLLDWILASDNTIEIPFPIITEHAIPFCFPLYKDKQMVVLDDSIFYGATLHNIRQVLQWCNGTNCKIKFYPIVARNKDAAKELGINNEDTFFISEEDVPLYTYTNSMCILSQNYPMEVEFPILTFQKEDASPNTIYNIESVLENHFNNSHVYTVSHKLYSKDKGNYNLPNYTVLLKPKGDSYSYDFAKLRIYVNGNIIMVVPIAPIVLSNDILNTEALSIFQETGLQSLWDDVIMPLRNTQEEISSITTSIESEEMKKEYSLRKNKSLAVWANYLASFSKLLEYKKELDGFLNKIGYKSTPSLNKSDISNLIGMSDIKGYPIIKLLSELYVGHNFEHIHKPRNGSYHWDNYIPLPSEYEEIYQKRNSVVWSKCKSITQALSYMVSNQYYYVNKAFNEFSPKRIEKSRYGVTFPYLQTELCNYGEERDNEKQLLIIHHWIDKKIDEGTVIPKFEQRYQDDLGTYYWRRYFKCGENEDSLLYIVRICIYIYQEIVRCQHSDYVKRRNFEELAITFFCNFDAKFNFGYALSESFDYHWNEYNKVWNLYYKDEIIDHSFLLIEDLLCAQTFFRMEKVGDYECILINENGITDFLRKAVPLEKNMCERLSDYIMIYMSCKEPFTTYFNIFRKSSYDDNIQVVTSKLRSFLNDFHITGKMEGKTKDLDNYTEMLDVAYYKSFIPEIPIEAVPAGLNNIDLFFTLSNKSKKAYFINFEWNMLLYKWELFLTMYKDNDIERALLIIDYLEDQGVVLDDVVVTLKKYNHINEMSSDVKNALLRRVRSLF